MMGGRSLDRARRALLALPEWSVTYAPGPQGRLARALYWRARMRHVGEGVTFGVGVQVVNPEYVSIGDGCWIDDYAILLAGPPEPPRPRTHYRPNPHFHHQVGVLHIGEGCHIAPHTVVQAHGGVSIGREITVAAGCKVYSLSHHYRDLTDPHHDPARVFKFSSRARPEDQAFISGPVVLEDFCALGLNSVVLPGSTIHQGAWVGVMSTVCGEIPANVVASGQPARVIRTIR